MTGIISPPMARTRTLTCTFCDATSTGFNNTAYTYAGRDVSDSGHPNRKAVFIITAHYDSTGTIPTISVTIDGLAFVLIASSSGVLAGNAAGGEGPQRIATYMFEADISTLSGATATLQINSTETIWRLAWQLYVVVDGDQIDADIGSDSSTSAPEGGTISLTTVAGGITIAIGASVADGAPTSSSSNLGTGTVDIANIYETNIDAAKDINIRLVSYRTASTTSGSWTFEPGASSRSVFAAVHYGPTTRR
jgi:hypothetical protein